MDTLQIILFGRVRISRDTTPLTDLPAKAQELLCYLLLHSEQPHLREVLACTLWGEASAAQAKKYLRQCLWQLQQLLDASGTAQAPLLRVDRAWVEVHPDARLQVDALQFEQAFARVRNIDGAALDPDQMQTIQAAAALYHGDLLSGWYQDWCLVERARYQAMFFAMLDKLMDFCLVHCRFDQGIAYGMHLLDLEYTRESTHRRLMQLYSAVGDRTAALRQFELCAAALQNEFGVEPTGRTIALLQEIRNDNQDDRREYAVPSPPSTEPHLLAQVLVELSHIRASISMLQRNIEQIKQALHQQTR